MRGQPRLLPIFLAFTAFVGIVALAATADASTVLKETFSDDSWRERWIPSADPKYSGKFGWEASTDTEDKGLLVTSPARHYAISHVLPTPFKPNGGTTVLQYEVRLQNGLTCGGAYLKFLTHDAAFTPGAFTNESPYTIMFGPDRCGTDTNKVHFILRHRNPISGAWEEKHLQGVPAVPSDALPHVYTAILRADNSVTILVDGEEKKVGSLLADMAPPVNPDKEIVDPNDVKPKDWVDEASIPDPSAVKPADWDEDAPREVEDEDAVMPAGWLEDEPEMVEDSEVAQPDDWDEDEDGAWEPPLVRNPRCEGAPGCGPWKRPMKRNPKFQGKWTPPLIPNPKYKGPWAPRKIPNPHYHKDTQPSDVAPIGAVGIEIWTMSDGIMFDNVLLTSSEEEAAAFREDTWAGKHAALKALAAERAPQEADEPSDVSVLTDIIAYIEGILLAPQWRFAAPLTQPLLSMLRAYPFLLPLVALVPEVLLLGTLYHLCCVRGRRSRHRAARAAKASAAAAPPPKAQEVVSEAVPIKQEAAQADDGDTGSGAEEDDDAAAKKSSQPASAASSTARNLKQRTTGRVRRDA
eukprot:jgi/Mesvir1/7445/Mv19224-RA.1